MSTATKDKPAGSVNSGLLARTRKAIEEVRRELTDFENTDRKRRIEDRSRLDNAWHSLLTCATDPLFDLTPEHRQQLARRLHEVAVSVLNGGLSEGLLRVDRYCWSLLDDCEALLAPPEERPQERAVAYEPLADLEKQGLSVTQICRVWGLGKLSFVDAQTYIEEVRSGERPTPMRTANTQRATKPLHPGVIHWFHHNLTEAE